MAKGKLAALVLGPPEDEPDDKPAKATESGYTAIAKDIISAIKDDDPEALGEALEAYMTEAKGKKGCDCEDGTD